MLVGTLVGALVGVSLGLVVVPVVGGSLWVVVQGEGAQVGFGWALYHLALWLVWCVNFSGFSGLFVVCFGFVHLVGYL